MTFILFHFIMKVWLNDIQFKGENKMNKFYYFEGRIFETKEQAESVTKNYVTKILDEIETEKSFEEFETIFDELKEQGESDADAIEMAK